MRALLLKAGTTVVAMGATVMSSVYVTSHIKNPSAPLQPTVLNASNPSVTVLGGTVAVGPSVQPSNTQPVTSTYAS